MRRDEGARRATRDRRHGRVLRGVLVWMAAVAVLSAVLRVEAIGGEPPAEPASGAIRVAVTSMDGKPIPGALVELLRGPEIDRTEPRNAPTDAPPGTAATRRAGDDGAATFDGAAPGRWFVAASAPGFARHVIAGVTLGAAGVETRVSLEKGATFHGRIRESGGEPAAGIAVLLVPESYGAEIWSRDVAATRTTTDANGLFRFDAAEPGRHSLWYAPHAGILVRGGEVLLPGVDQIDVRMVEGGTIAGVVRDAVTGEPMPAARVVAYDGLDGPIDSVITDLEGRYSMRTHRDHCFGWILRVEAPGHVRDPIVTNQRTVASSLGERERVEVDLTVARSASVHGRLTGPRGPLAGRFVQFVSQDDRFRWRSGPGLPSPWTRTGPDGSFRIDGLPAGPATAWVIDSDDRRLATGQDAVELIAGKDVEHDVHVEVEPPESATYAARVVTGSVVRVGGAPAAGLRLRSGAEAFRVDDGVVHWDGTNESVTAADGSFRMTLTGGRDRWLFVFGGGDVQQFSGLSEPAATRIRVELAAMVRVTGVVVTAASGRPVAGVHVCTDRDGLIVARTGEDGRFAVDWSPGSWQSLSIAGEGWESAPVQVVAAEQRIELKAR